MLLAVAAAVADLTQSAVMLELENLEARFGDRDVANREHLLPCSIVPQRHKETHIASRAMYCVGNQTHKLPVRCMAQKAGFDCLKAPAHPHRGERGLRRKVSTNKRRCYCNTLKRELSKITTTVVRPLPAVAQTVLKIRPEHEVGGGVGATHSITALTFHHASLPTTFQARVHHGLEHGVPSIVLRSQQAHVPRA